LAASREGLGSMNERETCRICSSDSGDYEEYLLSSAI
jgi:hypothetical protein